MRPCVAVEASTSIRLAIEKMREAGQESIPVVEDGKIFGVLTESGVLRFVGDAASDTNPVSSYSEPAVTISNRASGAEALRQLEKTPSLAVVDDGGMLCGLVTPSCFVGSLPEKPRPHMVGGMATPFGVYLTTGAVRGGKQGWYLFSTGFFLISLVLLGGILIDPLFRSTPNTQLWQWVAHIASVLPMILAFRLFPIAGYHAAEHQVVHAIERDEELTPEVVARMPRVHPRCGTNLAVAAGIFAAITFNPWLGENEGSVFLALLVTVFFWKPVGSFIQYWITTKKPNSKQIESGIQAGRELLANYEIAPNRVASPSVRFLNSGLIHVIAGSTAASLLFELIARMFGTSLLFGN